jgi:hypothetical protein
MSTSPTVVCQPHRQLSFASAPRRSLNHPTSFPALLLLSPNAPTTRTECLVPTYALPEAAKELLLLQRLPGAAKELLLLPRLLRYAAAVFFEAAGGGAL